MELSFSESTCLTDSAVSTTTTTAAKTATNATVVWFIIFYFLDMAYLYLHQGNCCYNMMLKDVVRESCNAVVNEFLAK